MIYGAKLLYRTLLFRPDEGFCGKNNDASRRRANNGFGARVAESINVFEYFRTRTVFGRRRRWRYD